MIAYFGLIQAAAHTFPLLINVACIMSSSRLTTEVLMARGNIGNTEIRLLISEVHR